MNITTTTTGVCIDGRNVTWRELERAAAQDDPARIMALDHGPHCIPPQDEETRRLATHYRGILAIARQMEAARIEAVRIARVRAHAHHEAAITHTTCFGGCVADSADDCNPAAHGGVTHRHQCACGAISVENVNGNHAEGDAWA